MTIIFVRHGETALNAARVLQPADTPLGPRGLLQAEAVAQRLGAMQPAAIVSSDLPRAWQTAQAIARACGLARIETSPLLHERNFGDLRGRPYDTLGFDPLAMTGAPPNGESDAEFSARVGAAFAWVLARQAGLTRPLVVVSHGLVIGRLLRDRVVLGAEQPERIGNTALTIVSPAPPHGVSLCNCTRHLDGALDEGGRSLSGG
jgi:broad specificity phosphatase PhoE